MTSDGRRQVWYGTRIIMSKIFRLFFACVRLSYLQVINGMYNATSSGGTVGWCLSVSWAK